MSKTTTVNMSLEQEKSLAEINKIQNYFAFVLFVFNDQK